MLPCIQKNVKYLTSFFEYRTMEGVWSVHLKSLAMSIFSLAYLGISFAFRHYLK